MPPAKTTPRKRKAAATDDNLVNTELKDNPPEEPANEVEEKTPSPRRKPQRHPIRDKYDTPDPEYVGDEEEGDAERKLK